MRGPPAPAGQRATSRKGRELRERSVAPAASPARFGVVVTERFSTGPVSGIGSSRASLHRTGAGRRRPRVRRPRHPRAGRFDHVGGRSGARVALTAELVEVRSREPRPGSHPTADRRRRRDPVHALDPSRRRGSRPRPTGARVRDEGARGPAPALGRAVHHPSGGGRHHHRRPRPRHGERRGGVAARRRRGHRREPRADRGGVRPGGGGDRGRGHEAGPAAFRLEGGAAGRDDAQDARRDGPGLAGARHQARGPAPQHADSVGDARVEAAPDRRGDAGHLRAARRTGSGSRR